MPNGGHVGENAELYALGTLSELERARVDEHVRTCDPCAQRVGEAEETALRLIDAAKMPAIPLPAVGFASRARLPAWMAPAAAAFVAGFIVTGLWAQRDRAADDAARSTTQAAQRAMLAGHFAHAPFVAREPRQRRNGEGREHERRGPGRVDQQPCCQRGRRCGAAPH